MDKLRLREALLLQLEATLALQLQAALTSRDEATHEESKPENKYDMHAQEAAYLAEGQARLVAELQETLALYRSLDFTAPPPGGRVAVGSLVRMESGPGTTAHVFLGPRSGGLEVTVDGSTVLVVTPASPLGKQLLGRSVGDSVPLPGRRGPAAGQRIAEIR